MAIRFEQYKSIEDKYRKYYDSSIRYWDSNYYESRIPKTVYVGKDPWISTGSMTGRFTKQPNLGGNEMPAKFKTGDLVTVTLRDIQVVEGGFYGDYLYGKHRHIERSERTSAARNSAEFFLNFGTGVELITSGGGISSSEFKPEPGEVYEADYELWYVRKYEGSSGTVVISDVNGTEYSDSPTLTGSKSLESFARKRPVMKMDKNGTRVNK